MTGFLTDREKLITMVSNDIILPSDAIVVLEGDFYSRADRAIGLFGSGFSDLILVSGGLDRPESGSFHADRMKDYMIKRGRIPAEKIILETGSMDTRMQAVNVMNVAKEKNWKALILVASHFHQFRAYLTFIKAMKETGIDLLMFNVTARNLSWFDNDLNHTRFALLDEEFQKIEEYGKLGHVVSFEEAFDYQRWKESEAKKYGDNRPR